jgi:hypothetical protein
MEINSGEDYGNVIINGILEIEEKMPDDQKMPVRLLELWLEEIKAHATNTYFDYVIGKREHYEFDEEEIKAVYDLAGMRYTQELLDGLVDKGMVEVSVGENGDLLYSTTEEGKKAIGNSEEAE